MSKAAAMRTAINTADPTAKGTLTVKIPYEAPLTLETADLTDKGGSIHIFIERKAISAKPRLEVKRIGPH